MILKGILGLVALVPAAVSAAVVHVVPAGETFVTNVTADATLGDEWLIAGTFCKLGPGKLTVPAKTVWFMEGRLDVLQGSAEIVTTGEEAVFDATAVANKAAFWVKAGVNCVKDDAENLVQWRDARDNGSAAQPSLPFAKAMTNLSDNAAFPETGLDGTRPYVYFGGYASGRWMFWRKADDSDRLWLNAVHTFAVYNPLDQHGNVFGTENYMNQTRAEYFAVSGGSAGTTLFCSEPRNNPGTYAPVRLGRVFLNGSRAQPTQKISLNTVQLIETRSGPKVPGADSFFNFNNYQVKSPNCTRTDVGNRVGGGRLHEVLVYTNRLAEAERILLEGRLLRTWNLATVRAPKTVNVARGATLDSDSGYLDGTDCRFEGDLGAASLAALQATAQNAFGPYAEQVRLASGEVTTNCARLVAADCTNLVLTVTDGGVMRATAGTAGVIEKRGAGPLALAGVPAGAALKVAEGRVAVSPHRAPARLATTNGNLIADGSFENLTRSDGMTVGETRGAWVAETAENSVRLYNNGDWASRIPNTSVGRSYLHVKGFTNGFASVRQTFTVPVAGRHELTFRTATRNDGEYAPLLGVYIDDIRIATVVVASKTFWETWRFVTPPLAAGEHVLRFRHELKADRSSAIDDVRLVWYDDARTVPFPNADFESVGFGSTTPSGANLRTVYRYSGDRTLGWTVNDATLASVVRYEEEDFSVTGSAAAPAPFERGGEFALLLVPGGAVTNVCTVTESGRYAFSLHAAKVGEGNALLTTGTSIPLNVSVNGRSETLNVSTFAFGAYEGGVVHDLVAGETVTLVLSLDEVDGYRVVVDDVALTRLPVQNLLTNPSFEIGADASFRTNGWDCYIAPGDGGTARNITYLSGATFNDNNFGSSVIHGPTRLRIYAADGWIRQTVTLPEAGLYRFAFWARSRVTEPGNGFTHWPEALDVFAVVDGVTNLAARAAISKTSPQFQRSEYLFRAPRAGASCTVEIHGTRDGDYSAFVDACCLERVEEGATAGFGEAASVEVASGATLALDYAGTNTVSRVRVAGIGRSGVLSGDVPQLADCLEGPGALYATPQGTFILVR